MQTLSTSCSRWFVNFASSVPVPLSHSSFLFVWWFMHVHASQLMMLCSLAGAFCWVTLATYFKWPVSTTYGNADLGFPTVFFFPHLSTYSFFSSYVVFFMQLNFCCIPSQSRDCWISCWDCHDCVFSITSQIWESYRIGTVMGYITVGYEGFFFFEFYSLPYHGGLFFQMASS